MLVLWMFSAVAQNDIEMSRGLRDQFQTRNEAPGEWRLVSVEGRVLCGCWSRGEASLCCPRRRKERGKVPLFPSSSCRCPQTGEMSDFLGGIEPELFHCVLKNRVGGWLLSTSNPESSLCLAFCSFSIGLFMRGDPWGSLPAQDILIQF